MPIIAGAILHAVASFASRESNRFPALSFVRVRPGAGHKTILEASDGCRLIRVTVNGNGAADGFISPDVAKSVKGGDAVRIEGTEVRIYSAKTGLETRADYAPKPGAWPDVESCIPEEPTTFPTISASRFGTRSNILGDTLHAIGAMDNERERGFGVPIKWTPPTTKSSPMRLDAFGSYRLNERAALAAQSQDSEKADAERDEIVVTEWRAVAVVMPCEID